MKLHEEFKLYETMWDDKSESTLVEDHAVDPAGQVLNKISKVKFEYDEFKREWVEDRFGWDGHYQDGGVHRYPAFTYEQYASTVFEDLRDTIIPKYGDSIPSNDLLDTYKKLDQACEDATKETADEAYAAFDLFLAENLLGFVELFNDVLLEYYEEAAQDWAVKNLEPRDFYDDYDDYNYRDYEY